MHDIRLKIGTTLYGGWLSVKIKRSMASIAGTFNLIVTDKWSGESGRRPVVPGTPCQVLVDDAPIITGYVDDVNISYDSAAHSISLAGRDKTGDLVDCSAPIADSGSQLLGDFLGGIKKLCQPYGIAVRSDLAANDAEVAQALSHFPGFRVNPGESVFERLDAAARVCGVLLISDGIGGLVVTRASRQHIDVTLEPGENVLSGALSFSQKDRFHLYEVVGAVDTSDWTAVSAQTMSARASARDNAVRTVRSKFIQETLLRGNADAKRRVEFERNVRFGHAQSIAYAVKGWHYAPGKVWPINRLVHVRDELLNIEAKRLISAVEFSLDESGFRTALTLVPREAFDLVPMPSDNWDAI